MRFNVTFYGASARSEYGIFGPGVLHVDETAMLLEGDVPRFPMPVALLWQATRRLICDRSVRTVPYSRIVSHKPPSFLNRRHRLDIRLPSGKRQRIAFRLTDAKHRSDTNETVGTLIEQHREVARSLLGTHAEDRSS